MLLNSFKQTQIDLLKRKKSWHINGLSKKIKCHHVSLALFIFCKGSVRVPKIAIFLPNNYLNMTKTAGICSFPNKHYGAHGGAK